MPFNVVFGDNFDRSDTRVWCRQLWESLDEGGTWTIPRSCLIFMKINGKLVLHMAMPWMPEMEGVITPEQLQKQLDSDFSATVKHFGEIGITVERKQQ